MSDIVPVIHPIPHRYLPRRSRTERFGFGMASTPVILHHVEGKPREVSRIGDSRILSAEGQAWTVLREGRENVSPDALRSFLADPSPTQQHGRKALALWASRSPLMYQDEGLGLRAGPVDVAQGVTLVEDGTERAIRDVVAFLDDRVRIHGERVLVRLEALVTIKDVLRAAPAITLENFPRIETTSWFRGPSLLAIRPDRLGAVWDLHERVRKGSVPSGQWEVVAGIPEELRREDDAAWVANRLPAMLMSELRNYNKDLFNLSPDHPNERFRVLAALFRMGRAIEGLDRRGKTHSIAGDEVEPAVALLGQAVGLAVRAHALKEAESPTKDGRPVLRTYEFLSRVIDQELLPRLQALPVLTPEDDEALAGFLPA